MSIVHRDVRLVEKQVFTGDTFQLTFESSGLAASLEPGNFIHIKTTRFLDPLFRRAMSIHSKSATRFSVFFRVVGRGTRLMSEIDEGELVDVVGPLGNTFTLPNPDETAVMVAGGTGMPPMYFLARKLLDNAILPKEQIVFLCGVSSSRDKPIVDHPKSLNIKLGISSDDGSIGHKGFVTELLEQELRIRDIDKLRVYSCGPEQMLSEVARLCLEYGAACQVSLEGDMPCGVGTCLGCVRESRDNPEEFHRVCKEGPVFDIREVKI